MNSQEYILSIDQGTTSSRAILFNVNSEICHVSQIEFQQIFPKPGWVEHDPDEILKTQLRAIDDVLSKVDPKAVVAIGIANQRETTVVWNSDTGEPIYNAIVWQDKRTADICDQLKADGHEQLFKERTGLVLDSYFSGSKISWILDQVDGAKELSHAGKLLFGTIDTWLIWNLTNRSVHATDFSNASRTLLFNIRELKWDDELLDKLNVPQTMLPLVQDSSSDFGYYEYKGVSIPICGVAGDQQAALFGQLCFNSGMAKNTYGTGCFMLMNTGQEAVFSEAGLLTTIAWGIHGKVFYALEGSVFVAGAALQWLRDGLELFKDAKESEGLAQLVEQEEGVYFVPAFAGLGAPYWDMYARGAIFGLTRDTNKNHITKAALESLAFQTKDVLAAMEKDLGSSLSSLAVDGGACANNYLMQFQADLLDVEVDRPKVIESTALGVAYLAGINKGVWTVDSLKETRESDRIFKPNMEAAKRDRLYKGWINAVKRTMNWLD
jgi:glycerol kinase